MARKLRGSDFLMRWEQGYWSEKRLLEAINQEGTYYAIPYGPSGVAPREKEEHEQYFAKLDAAGLGKFKRPDILVFHSNEQASVDSIIESLGGLEQLPFTPESATSMCDLLSLAVVGIECENSLWRAAKMPAFNAALRPQKRLDGKLGLAKTAVLPTIFIKDEDKGPLLAWQAATGVKIHVWHSFFDMSFGIALDEAQRLIDAGLIEPTVNNYGDSRKIVYKIYHLYAYELGKMVEFPTLNASSIEDNNGHIYPYVIFSGGKIELEKGVTEILDEERAKNTTSGATG